MDPALDRGGDHAAHEGDSVRAPARHAVRSRAHRRDRPARGIPVIEDAACAIGSEILWNGRWEKIGKPHGDIACFSFHPRKVITTGDGGMITTAESRVRSQVPPVAAALDERARHGAARRRAR